MRYHPLIGYTVLTRKTEVWFFLSQLMLPPIPNTLCKVEHTTDLYYLIKALSGCLLAGYKNNDSTFTLAVHRQRTKEVVLFLKLHSALCADIIVDCYATDSIDSPFRFTVVYTLRSSVTNLTFHILTKTTETLALVSLQDIFPGFNWAERELWDLMGILFLAHPDLRRVLTDYGFKGHPLRKDFPLTGFREVHFDEITKKIEYSPVELTQSMRQYHTISSWQGPVNA